MRPSMTPSLMARPCGKKTIASVVIQPVGRVPISHLSLATPSSALAARTGSRASSRPAERRYPRAAQYAAVQFQPEELDAIADFLEYVSGINTANWPPNIQG